MSKIIKNIIFWAKEKLGIIQWIAEPFYWQENDKIYCSRCGVIDWKKKGDLDVHDMIHWE